MAPAARAPGAGMLSLILGVALGSVPCAGFPLKSGTTWTYRARVAWDGTDSAHHATVTWTTTVVAVHASDSTLAATVRGWPADLAWWQPHGNEPTTTVLYCAGNRVYLSRPSPGAAPALAASLLSGAQRPSADDLLFELPLHRGRLYGRDTLERQDTFYAWFVESAAAVPPSVRRLRPGLSDSLYSVTYRTNPDHTILGVVPGLGVVHYAYAHHGTVAEVDAWLVAYREGHP